MVRASGAVAVALVTLIVCCTADSRQEQEEHNSANRYDNDIRERQELDRFLQYLLQSEMRNSNGRHLDGIGGSFLGRSLGARIDGLGGSSLLGRSLTGNKALDGLGGSSLIGRSLNEHYARYVDSLGGGNFVRNLDSIGGGNFVRNLDSLGGGNLVKKNLDAIGGPNLVKRHVDSLGGGNLVRNLDSIGGGNKAAGGSLVRQSREAHRYPHNMGRRYEYISPLGGRNLLVPYEYAYYGDGLPKRNFDEIDRSNLNTFVKKRNFDEIDQSSMPFPFKRFYPLMGPNYLDMPVSSLDKKRYRPDYPMDEIDFSQFPIGSKRSGENTHSLR